MCHSGCITVLSPTLEDLDEREQSRPVPRQSGECAGRSHATIAAAASLLSSRPPSAVFFLWLAVSLGSALTNPALGSSMGARAAEWLREHGGASIVVWAENEWYSHHQPKVGGSLAAGTIRKPKAVTEYHTGRRHVAAPADASANHTLCQPSRCGRRPMVAGGATVDGLPAVYETMLRPDADPHQLRSGCRLDGHRAAQGSAVFGKPDPGRRPLHPHRPHFAGRRHDARRRLQCWLLDVRRRRRVLHRQQNDHPLRTGAASFVVYKNGSATVGQWGGDVRWGPTSCRFART